jgi:hypothetical protein
MPTRAPNADVIVLFPKKYTKEETAEITGMSVATLARERRAGRIRAYTPGKRKIYYLEPDIIAYMERPDRWAEKNSSQDASETTGSLDSLDRHSGIEHGSIEALDKRDAKASALRILTAPTSCSRSGSPSTSSCTAPNRKT